MNNPVKVLLFLVVAAVVVFVLFTAVFPWVDRTLITDPTLDAAGVRVGLGG